MRAMLRLHVADPARVSVAPASDTARHRTSAVARRHMFGARPTLCGRSARGPVATRRARCLFTFEGIFAHAGGSGGGGAGATSPRRTPSPFGTPDGARRRDDALAGVRVFVRVRVDLSLEFAPSRVPRRAHARLHRPASPSAHAPVDARVDALERDGEGSRRPPRRRHIRPQALPPPPPRFPRRPRGSPARRRRSRRGGRGRRPRPRL